MLQVVAGLLFHSVSHAVYAARDSFFYALPAVLCLFAASWMWLEEINAFIIFVALLAAAMASTQFLVATIRKMMAPHLFQPYRQAMRWTRASSDFFVFVALAFAAMGALAVFLLDFAVFLYEYSFTVSAVRLRRMTAGELENSGIRASFALVIFGSRILAAAALLLAVSLWSRLCRIGIQIPAHVEGYYLSAPEAIDVTRGRAWHLLALSLIINGGISALGGALLTAMESSFDGEVPHWASAAATGTGLWVVGLFNAGYWTAVYREHASGYVMRREIY